MKIKVCGMKFRENITAVSELEIDYMGFIFYPKSPRNFEGKIEFESKSIQKIGVFVNEKIAVIAEKIEENDLDVIQLHGNESASYCKELKKMFPEIEFWKSFSVDEKFDFESIKIYQSIDKILLDTKGKNFGGNGIQFDWKILENYKMEKNIILSGGISPEDVLKIKEIQSKVPQILGIDINSRFETEPGRKDVDLLKNFMKNLTIEK